MISSFTPVLADDEVVGQRCRQIDATAVAVGGIGPADEVVVRSEQVTGEGSVVEVDAFDAGFGVGAGDSGWRP